MSARSAFLDKRAKGEKLDWHDLGGHSAEPYAFNDGRYKPADEYWIDDHERIGIEFVLTHRLNSEHPTEWVLNQDVVIALGLMREGDKWVRVDEGYIDVVRMRRDASGDVVAIEMRAEHLRDYLAARGLVLRLASYRQRLELMDDASHLPWTKTPQRETAPGERFELQTFEVDASGGPYGGSVAVFRARRTDVDPHEDVPVFGPETDANTASESFTFDRGGTMIYRAEGELWRMEWVEPASRSERVRGDKPEEDLFYSVGAGGERKAGSTLTSEEVGIYLWFRAEVINALLGVRGASLDWYSQMTGNVRCSPDYGVHFGVNTEYRINVYACDIAKLPLWQQKIWHGHGISPDGPPSRELLASQQECEPAGTKSPEVAFGKLLHFVNTAFEDQYGSALFKPHEHSERILRQCHRFRCVEENGVLALAKDIARLTTDSIDVGLLRRIAPPDPKEKPPGSLKMLERVLAKHVDADEARDIMGAMHDAYNLRLGDAHLPSSAIDETLKRLGIGPGTHPVQTGLILLSRVCDCLYRVRQALGTAPANEEPPART